MNLIQIVDFLIQLHKKVDFSFSFLLFWHSLNDFVLFFQILQKDIESHSRVVSAVLKLSECLQNGVNGEKNKDDPIIIPESLQQTSHSLEKRWHAIWLQSLEWHCRLEQAIHSKKVSTQKKKKIISFQWIISHSLIINFFVTYSDC